MNSRKSKKAQIQKYRPVNQLNQSQTNAQSTSDGKNPDKHVSEIVNEDSNSLVNDAAEAITRLDFTPQGEDALDSNAEALRRLNELKSCSKNVEISEEQLMVNDQLQQDELMALEAIYGDSIFIFEKMDCLHTFQIHIHLELPDDFNVHAELHSSPESSRSETENGAKEVLHTFKVQFLPPMKLTCMLPPSYPSDNPPYFTLHTEWLDSIRISNLCKMLDNMWSEQPGEEVLYRWVEWLHSSSLSFLEFEHGVRLNLSHTVFNKGDRRAISGTVSVEAEIHSLVKYNIEKCTEVFLSELHQCVICYSQYPGTYFIKLPCHHFYCCKCMETYSNIHVKEGTVTKLLCPDSKCGGFIPPSILRKLLGNESYSRWESLMLDKTLASMSDVVYCPRCETACLEDEENHAQCSKCFFSFCSICRERRHVGKQCVHPQVKLMILQERLKNPNMSEDQRRKELEKIHDIKSMEEILRDAKQCPRCKMAISRTEGCNKMTCGECGQFFCYNCNKAIEGYDHYRNGECKLFPPEALELWEAQMMEVNQRVARVRTGQNSPHRVPCPSCRQMNAKEGNNNHIFCWSCRGHYCALCRQVVKHAARHYGPKGCKQHSV